MPKWILLGLCILLVLGVLAARPIFDPATVLSELPRWQSWIASYPYASAGVYFGLFVLLDALGLPVAAAFSSAAGALFALPLALVLALAGRGAGDAAAFLFTRYCLRGWMRRRYPSLQARMEESMRREGVYALFALRLIPGLPGSLVNIGMALTAMPFLIFASVNLAGIAFWTVALTFAGRELGHPGHREATLRPGYIVAALALMILIMAARLALRRRAGTKKKAVEMPPPPF